MRGGAQEAADNDSRQVTDHAWTHWNDFYTQEQMVELGIQPDRRKFLLQDS